MGTQVLKSAASAISPRPQEIGNNFIIQASNDDLHLVTSWMIFVRPMSFSETAFLRVARDVKRVSSYVFRLAALRPSPSPRLTDNHLAI
jgi:hypothetical protein